MRVAILGLGLIGGSIARALRDAGGDWTIVAWSPAGIGPASALAAGVVDASPTQLEEAVRDADLVVLAAPPLACLELVSAVALLRGSLRRGATVTDVASTKVAIANAADEAGLPFVGGHPMAGRETSGFESADAALFVDRPWVVVDPVHGGDVHAVERLAGACRARPLRLGAAEHDRAVAAVSHLPLVASVALVEAVTGMDGEPGNNWPTARRLAASGWRDMTRLALGDPAMGAGIAVTNARPLADLLRLYRDRVDAWLRLLEEPDGPDPALIAALLEGARERARETPR